ITNAINRCGALKIFQAKRPPMEDTSQKPENMVLPGDKIPCCEAMSCRFNVWAIITTDISAKPAGISYEMICAAERIAPNMEYLLFEPQPAINMPSVSTDIIAKI